MGDSGDDDDVPLDEGSAAVEVGCVGRVEAGNEVGGTDRDLESKRSYGRLRADAQMDASRPLAPIVCVVAVANRVRKGWGRSCAAAPGDRSRECGLRSVW